MEKPPAALLSRITNDTEKQDPLLWAFERYTNLQPHEDVLDVGCGVGRVALALSGFLTGRYEGFDVDPALIAWCPQPIALPNFGFTHVDLFNQSYTPRGAPASAFTFPTRTR